MNQCKKSHFQALTVIALIGLPAVALGQPEQINENASKLNVGFGAVHTNNINPTFDDELSAQGINLLANGQLSTRGEGVQYLIDYDASLSQWQNSDEGVVYDAEPSTADVSVRGLARLFLSPKWQIDAQAKHHTQDQAYGTGLSRLRKNVLAQDTMTLNSAEISASYGYDLSDRFVSITAGVNDRSYDDINPYASQFDVTEQLTEIEVGFRISPATQLLLRVGYRAFDFDQPQIDDSELYRALIGASWAPTASSTLRASVGGYNREFDVSPSRSGFLWNLAYRLTPNDRFAFTVDSKREATATENEFSSESIVSQFGAALSYRYSVRWSTALKVNYQLTEFDDLNSNKDLTESDVSAQLVFSISSFQSITADVAYKNVTSDDNVIDYNQTQIGLFWQYAF